MNEYLTHEEGMSCTSIDANSEKFSCAHMNYCGTIANVRTIKDYFFK